MVGYITTAHGIAQRLSEKWRHFACTLFVLTFLYISSLCWRGHCFDRHDCVRRHAPHGVGQTLVMARSPRAAS